jgi:predicted transporter
MIYILLTAAFIIIFFTNQISNINKKDRNNWLDDLLINNYKIFIGLLFLIFTFVFWRYSCFFISYNCQ